MQRTKGKAAVRLTISSLKKSYKYHRSPIDLPTAEPYLECTSDCDEYNESRLTSAKNSFRMQLKSGQQQQQQRLQTTEQTSTYELIVVSSQKSDSNTESEPATKSISDVKEKFNNVAVSELPAIKGSKRHTWQTMKK